MNVILLLSQPWKNRREFNEKTMHEKIEISETIMKLGFNQQKGGKWLAMISGDQHSMSYDNGELNLYGGFPIFQCSAADSKPSCKVPAWTSQISMRNGQYCMFDIYKTEEGKQCLKFEGFRFDQKVMDADLCSEEFEMKRYKELRLSDNQNAWNWFEIPGSIVRDEMVAEANDILMTLGTPCPDYSLKQIARAPLYFWLLIVGIFVFYSAG